MRATNPANADDIQRMLGEVDPLIAERILATGATSDEIGEALREVEDEHGFGEASHRASSPRVAEVRALLDEMEILDDDELEGLEEAP